MSWLTDLLGWNTKAEIIPAESRKSFPSDDEAKFAREAGAGYGSGLEAFFEEGKAKVSKPTEAEINRTRNLKELGGNNFKRREVTGDNADLFMKNYLASMSSSIAGLGFEPRNTNLTENRSGKQYNIGGAYQSDTDRVFSFDKVLNDDKTKVDNSSLLHESIHRGMEKLRNNRALLNDEEKEALSRMSLAGEEYMVRYIMDTKIGNPEEGFGDSGDKQIAASRELYKDREKLKNFKILENAAARIFASQRPGGPR